MSDSQLSEWLTEVAAWMRSCPFEEGREFAKDVDQAIAKAKELEYAVGPKSGVFCAACGNEFDGPPVNGRGST